MKRAAALALLPALVALIWMGRPRLPASADPPSADYPVLWQRPAAGEAVVTVLLVGDVGLGRGVAPQRDPFAQVPWLAAADLTIANLESPLTRGVAGMAATATPIPEAWDVRADPAAAELLQRAGIDLLTLANNHSLDDGPAGLAHTAAVLHQRGLATAGGEQPLWRGTIRGVRLAVLAFNRVGATADAPAAMTAAVQEARAAADVVLVAVHWGREYDPRPTPAQERLAAALLEAGATAVIGHHPHVAQPVRVTDDGRLTAFSLGNFLFDSADPATADGLALWLELDVAGLRAAQLWPVRAGWRPRLQTPEEAETWLGRIVPPRPRRAWRCVELSECRPFDAAPSPTTSGRFWSGALDLTGDGAAELVRREGERVRIYRDGALAWESPEEWRVRDLALGDPNNDGRGELLLAIWRQDEEGYWRSQPYLVGQRGGAYRLLWGGRPARDPILEVEVGDVDGDGAAELIVLEEDHAGAGRAVTVWQWHGWGFTLHWRSPYGRYGDLVFEPGPRGRPGVISAALGDD